MIKLGVSMSGKAVFFNEGEVGYLPAALIPYFIMFAGKTVEVKVDPGGPFTCISMSMHKEKATLIFELNKSRFRVCSDIAHQALDNYEPGKTYHLAVKECSPAKSPSKPRAKKPKSRKGKKDGK